MNWFYAKDGQQAGPVEDSELDRLVQTGTINTATLVWHSGLTSWEPYSQARNAVAYAGAGAPAAGSSHGNALAPGAGQVRCSECTRVFPADEVVQIEGLNVCADCKPIVLQKLREGVRPTGAGFEYGGFWTRFGAVFIDGIIVNICTGILGYVLRSVLGTNTDPGSHVGAVWLVQGVIILIAASYEIILIAKYGATLGKMACGLKVVRPDGSLISYPRSIGRYFGKFLSGIILAIGYIMAAFDPEKRALHDQICDTRVVKKG